MAESPRLKAPVAVRARALQSQSAAMTLQIQALI